MGMALRRGGSGGIRFFAALVAAVASLAWPLAAPAQDQGDIVFMVDESGSMGPIQQQVRDNLASMTSQIDGTGIDARYGLVGYGSVQSHGALTGHTHTDFTDVTTFQGQLGTLVESGSTEAAFDAIVHAGTLSYRPTASACLVMVTDENADIVNASQQDAIDTLTGLGITFFGIFEPGDTDAPQHFDPLANSTGGQNFDLDDFIADPSTVLNALGVACADAIRQSNISLDPPSATNPLGTPHQVTATLEDDLGNRLSGVTVTFSILSGPNQGASGTCSADPGCATDANGQVSFEYVGTGGPGQDVIEACFVFRESSVQHCDRATKLWDAGVTLAIDDVTVFEGDSGTTPAVFTVSLSAAQVFDVSVDFATTDETAVAGSDYASASGTATIPANAMSTTVTIDVLGDLVDEPTETFEVRLSNPMNAAIADDTGIGTILDDERNGTFSCRSSVLRIGETELVVANPANQPCMDDAQSLPVATELLGSSGGGGLLGTGLIGGSGGVLGTGLLAGDGLLGTGLLGGDAGTLDLGGVLGGSGGAEPQDDEGVSVTLLEALTDQTPDDPEATMPMPGDGAVAEAAVARAIVSVLGVHVTADTLFADAAVECVASAEGLVPMFDAFSTITSLEVNGEPYYVAQDVPVVLTFGGVTVRINETLVGPTSIVQRALVVSAPPLREVVIAEAETDFEGNPCQE